MNITQIAEDVTERILEHEAEARAFEAEVERGRDMFDSACAAKFHEGCCEALRELLDTLEELIEPGCDTLPHSAKPTPQLATDDGARTE